MEDLRKNRKDYKVEILFIENIDIINKFLIELI